MNLQEFLLFFREHSGRYDLVGPTGADTGALPFIHAGQGFLDRQGVVPQERAILLRVLPQGGRAITLLNARAIEEVVLVGPTWKRPLEKLSPEEMRPLVGRTNGTPTRYAILPSRVVLSEDDPLTDGLVGQVDALAVGAESYTVIILNVPTDTEVGVEVVGIFPQQKLLQAGDANFWTLHMPNLLFAAAMRQLEMVYRNSEGIRDWEMAMARDLQTLDFDRVTEEMQGITQMGG